MSNNPSVIQWKEPALHIDEEADEVILSLGVVHLPAEVDPDNAERVLNVVRELINQMVEEDILPELTGEAPVKDDYEDKLFEDLDDDDDDLDDSDFDDKDFYDEYYEEDEDDF